MQIQSRAYAPATVANLGPGFDILGLAVDGAGDVVTVTRADDNRIQIRQITGDDGQLPINPNANTASIAAKATLKRVGLNMGLIIDIEKGLPIGSGLGSSAASAVAAAVATNALIGSPLRPIELIEPCLEAEAIVSGRHADNIAPALLGGLVLVRSLDPLDLLRIPTSDELSIAVVTPKLSVSTKAARAVLPQAIPLKTAVQNAANLAAMLWAIQNGDTGLLSRSVIDDIATPARAHLVPGGTEAMEAAWRGGALGTAMSGAGPSFFALCASQQIAERVGTEMSRAFERAGHPSQRLISGINTRGARVL